MTTEKLYEWDRDLSHYESNYVDEDVEDSCQQAEDREGEPLAQPEPRSHSRYSAFQTEPEPQDYLHSDVARRVRLCERGSNADDESYRVLGIIQKVQDSLEPIVRTH